MAQKNQSLTSITRIIGPAALIGIIGLLVYSVFSQKSSGPGNDKLGREVPTLSHGDSAGGEKVKGISNSGDQVATSGVTPTLSLKDHEAIVVEPALLQSAAKQLSPATKKLIIECTQSVRDLDGVKTADEFQTLDDYLKKAFKSKLAQVNLETRNVHVKLANGEVLRGHIVQESAGAESQVKSRANSRPFAFKVYSTDRESLPVPVDIPAHIRDLPIRERLVRFAQQGQVVLDEAIETRRWQSGISTRQTRRNGVIEELELFLGSQALACSTSIHEISKKSQLNCLCLR
jgi:hypothetical protein